MTFKYNKFKCYWAAVTEKKHQIVSKVNGPFNVNKFQYQRREHITFKLQH